MEMQPAIPEAEQKLHDESDDMQVGKKLPVPAYSAGQ